MCGFVTHGMWGWGTHTSEVTWNWPALVKTLRLYYVWKFMEVPSPEVGLFLVFWRKNQPYHQTWMAIDFRQKTGYSILILIAA